MLSPEPASELTTALASACLEGPASILNMVERGRVAEGPAGGGGGSQPKYFRVLQVSPRSILVTGLYATLNSPQWPRTMSTR